MRIIIIGAVAAGTSVAAKARRNSESAEIVVYEKDSDISYSGCGMPYAIGNSVEVSELTPRDPVYFKQKYNIDIFVLHEVISIDTAFKRLVVQNLQTQETFEDHYDQLVFSTGASAFIPSIEGVHQSHVFTLRTIQDMKKIKSFISSHIVQDVAIIGSGFIGLELLENFKKIGLNVHIIEKLPQISPSLDDDVAWLVEDYLANQGIDIITNASIEAIHHNTILLTNRQAVKADLVIVATGVKPNIALAKSIGVKLGTTGAIETNAYMQTNLPDIYACGDCVEYPHQILNKPVYRPMGSTANKTGRIVADHLFGIHTKFKGILGTSIYKVLDLHVGQTGLSEKEALNAGFDVLSIFNIKPNKPEYMEGHELTIKVITNRTNGQLLGAQVIGFEGVDKRIDVFATALSFKAKTSDLMDLDLAYAPPFSTTKDPIMYSGMIVHNALNRGRFLLTAQEVMNLIQNNVPCTIIDTRVPKQYAQGHVPGAINIPHEVFRTQIKSLDKSKLTITNCNKGVTGNATQNILIHEGFEQVYSISGGYRTFKLRYDHMKGSK